MSGTRLAPLLAALVALVVAGTAAGRPGSDTALARRLAGALATPNLDAARSAAVAVDLRTGAVVFARNPELPLLPASTAKLAVGYAALALLGSGFRFHTEVRGLGTLDGTVWRGDLVLRGHGDPTLGAEDLTGLAQQVAGWGITRVTGAVLGDESWFDGVRTGPGWKSSFYVLESPPLSALVAERALYRGKTSHNPALAAASLFRQALAEAGVTVAKRSRVGRAGESSLPLAYDISPPLAGIVAEMETESDNFVAELLLKELGVLAAGHGTTAAGAGVVREALERAGVPLAGVRLADGSGLSSDDRLTANALVALLRAAWDDPELREAFVASLALAGVSGTLEERLRDPPARGRVRAKTGTTNVASALAGFAGDRYVFAVLQNGSPVASWWARAAQDRFATVLAGGR